MCHENLELYGIRYSQKQINEGLDLKEIKTRVEVVKSAYREIEQRNIKTQHEFMKEDDLHA